MAQDTTRIGLDEADKIRQNALPPTLKSIYRGKREPGQKYFFFPFTSLHILRFLWMTIFRLWLLCHLSTIYLITSRSHSLVSITTCKRRQNLPYILIFRRLVIREMSMFTPIGADPFNPLLMQAVPPKRMDALHASKSGQVNISTPIQRSKSK